MAVFEIVGILVVLVLIGVGLKTVINKLFK
jgi:hypothetical protein